MKPHTSDFKNAIKEMGRELRGVITYGNTSLEEEIMSITPHYEANILKSVMKQLDLELSVDIPLETVINCQIGILVNEEYEMLNFGNYVVYSSEKQEDTNTYKIVCYDKILYAMKQNEDLGVTYPITIKNYLIALANKIGLTVASGTFYNQDLQIPSELYVGLEYTYRDILDEIAQATGSIICINTNDEIEVKYPNDLGSQTTVSGTNITISEHAGNKIVGTIIDGNTTQNGTPTPSNQVPINSAGDNINLLENTYTTSGTQSGIAHTKNANGTMLLNGTATATVFMILNTFNLPAGTYILSGCPNGGSENGYRQDILVGNNVIAKDFGSGGSFTLNETTSVQARIRIGSGTVINNLTFKPMIAKGSIATPYTSYGMGSINEVISNKNLFNMDGNPIDDFLSRAGYTLKYNNDKTITINGTGTGAYKYLRWELTLGAGTYIASGCPSGGSQNGYSFLIRVGNSSYWDYGNGVSFTLIEKTTIQVHPIRLGSTIPTFNNVTFKPMIRLASSSATSFVPHQEQNISIPCQQPMRSIGNVRDSFVKTDGVWYEKHNIGQVVLNGSESGWVERGNTSENYIKFRNANALPYDSKGDLLLISDYFVTNIGANNASYSGNAICGNSGNYAKWLHISIDNTIVNSVETFKTWLSTHNTEVIYQLAEPYYLECTEEQITTLEKISHTSLYSGDTHISSEGYLSITYFSTFETIDEEYLKDVNIDFSEVYGPVNSIVLSRAGESDNVYIQDETSVEQNGLCEIKIVDNQIMNFNDRDDYLPGLLSALDGLTYYKNDFNSTGILYYDVGDLYDVKIGENVYRCLMLNDEINVTTGIEERIYTDLPEQSQTDYSKADKTDRRINQTYLIVDKQNQIIESKVGKDEIISKINQTPETITINANKLGISANDVLNILAGNTLNLTSKNISITSNNFSVDASGNATMNNANITGGEIYIDKLNGGTTPAITVDATSVQKSVEIYGDKIEVNNETDPSRHYNMVIEGDGIYRNGNEYFVMKGLVKDYTPLLDNSLNQLQDSGFYYVGGNSVSNAPSGFTTWYMVLVVKISNTFIFQYAYSPSRGQIAIRTYSGATPTWSEWKFINLL